MIEIVFKRNIVVGALLVPLGLLSTGCGEEEPEGPVREPVTVDQAALCPDKNRSTLYVHLEGIDNEGVTDNDHILWGLFHEWPAMQAPDRAEVILGPDIGFPHELADNRVRPTDLILYACYDPNGDSPIEEICKDQDMWQLFDGGTPITFEVTRVHHLRLNLASGESEVIGVEDAETEYGCTVEPPDPMPATLTVTAESTTLVPEPGDTVYAALFSSFPPMGPPSGFESAEVTAFPATRTIEDIVAGDWFVSVCFDKGGDSTSCDGPGDVLVWHNNGAPLTLDSGADEMITVSLDP